MGNYWTICPVVKKGVKGLLFIDDLCAKVHFIHNSFTVRMNNGEPVQNVPRSIKEEGHQILKLTDNGDDTFTLIVRKVEDE